MEIKREPGTPDEEIYISIPKLFVSPDIKVETPDPCEELSNGHMPPDYPVDVCVSEVKEERPQSALKVASGDEQHLENNFGTRDSCTYSKTSQRGKPSRSRDKTKSLTKSKSVFACETCSKEFSRRNHLLNHARIHSGAKPFICEVCSKSFCDKSRLVRHERTHTGERPIVCKYCDKTFTNKSALPRHMMIHKGEKPYACEICNKTFRVRPTLFGHMRTHTGEKPFACEVCGKTFREKSNLLRHTKIHLK